MAAVSKTKKRVTNERRAQRLGTGEGIKREAPRRSSAGGSRIWLVGGLVAVLVLAGAGVAALLLRGDDGGGGGHSAAVVQERLSEETLDPISRPTWQPNYENLEQAGDALGMPGLSEVILHLHARLFIYVNGDQVVVPANVAFDNQGQVFEPIHTHDERGVVHVEAADENFQAKLQDFFDLWGVRFQPGQLGGYRQPLTVWVNGERLQGDPGAHVIEQHDVITVVSGDVPAGFEPRRTVEWRPGE
jgi:hypothetical protein